MFTIDITDEATRSLPAFDFTKLTAINTCPRWGLIRYDQHKAMPGTARSTALEMGAAAHDCFAAIRFFQLLEYGPEYYGSAFDPKLVADHAARVLGVERATELLAQYSNADGADLRTRLMRGIIYAANTSGYYDDPLDKRRTLSNLETSLIHYADNLELERFIPIYDLERSFYSLSHGKVPMIGVEIPFDLTINSEYDNLKVRYIGRMDGLMHDRTNKRIVVDENKTASRINAAWSASFEMSHQVTGYCLAASTYLGTDVGHANVYGLTVPLPKSGDNGGFVKEVCSRDFGRFNEWAKWFFSTVSMWNKYKDDPLEAPEYTHSCSRYFRPCSFIPLCAVTGEERKESYEQMITEEWSPLHERSEAGE